MYIPKKIYEPTVMSFRLTNIVATFYIMMNNLLRNLINSGSVAFFMDNVSVAMDTDKRHDEILEEVLKRIKENYLYVKLEKYIWKIKDVEFLGVMLELDRVKMENKKIKKYLDWLTLRRVNNMQKFLKLANYYRR